MTINGLEVNFRLSNRKQAAAVEAALGKLAVGETKIKNEKSDSLETVIGEVIDMFREFFVDALGVDVLEGCEDAQEAQNAYMEFLKEINRQKDCILSSYSPDRIK